MPARDALTGAPKVMPAVSGVRPEAALSPPTLGESRARAVADEASRSDRLATLALCGGAAVLAAFLFWLVRGALIDDTHITLAYARNLATGLHWGLIPTETANSATSPLNVLLLGGVTALLRLSGGVHPMAGLAVVFVGSAVALAWGWSRIAAALRLPPVVPALGVALVLFHPLVLSSAGLEVVLVPAALVGMLAAAVRGQAIVFGVVAGLAVLTRLDLIIFVVPLALASAEVRRRLPVATVAAAAVALPWFVWSWWYFGTAIPDTFAIKTVQRSFGPWTFVNGPQDLLDRHPLETVVGFAPALIGLAVVAGWAALRLARPAVARPELTPAAALGAAGAAHYLAYAQLGVPPYQWYYVPSLVALGTSLCVLLGAGHGGRTASRPATHPAIRGVALAGLALVACLTAGSLVAAVRDGAPWKTPPIFGNWATAANYEQVGRELGARIGDATVESPGEIGTLAYFCECSIVDAFADRGRAVPLIEARIAAASPAVRALLELNYLRLDRDQEPRPLQYRLIWEPGPVNGPDQWATWSPSAGVGHLRLEQLPPQ